MEVEGVGSVTTRTRGLTVLRLASVNNSFGIEVAFHVLDSVTSPTPVANIAPECWTHLQALDLADPSFGKVGRIDALIGADVWGAIVEEGIVRGSMHEPFAHQTKLGWVVFGSATIEDTSSPSVRSLHTHVDEDMAADQRFDAMVRLFCELDHEVTPTPDEDGMCEQIFLAISKTSRSIFMELEANVVAGKNQVNAIQRSAASTKQHVYSFNRHNNENEPERSTTPQQQDVVKYDEKPEDVKIETSELSTKFKFFEMYRPTERQKKEFRITPPREGVVKMPTPDSDTENNAENTDTNILEKSHTTAMIFNKFRELEQLKRNNGDAQMRPRPMKAFTPPPDGGKRLYQEQDSDMGSQEDDEEEDEDNDEDTQLYYRRSNMHMDDEALKEAQVAARAKQLRAKFEKWEANEKQRESHEGRVDIYSQRVSDDSNIESTKTIRERFENMECSGKHTHPAGPRYKVNRFV